jgi:putative intracellular protease/amidase
MAEPEFLIVEAIYPGMTQLDFTGPHTFFSRIPGARVVVASEPGGPSNPTAVLFSPGRVA